MGESLVMGIDPGSQVTGYGLILKEGRDFRAVDYGCIRPPRGALPSDRRLAIYEAIVLLLGRHTPDALSIETQFAHPRNPMSGILVGMVRGVAILAASQAKIPVYEYTPSDAKRAVTGNGQSKKEQVQGMVTRLLGLPKAPPLDATDALSIALCHHHRPKRSAPV